MSAESLAYDIAARRLGQGYCRDALARIIEPTTPSLRPQQLELLDALSQAIIERQREAERQRERSLAQEVGILSNEAETIMSDAKGQLHLWPSGHDYALTRGQRPKQKVDRKTICGRRAWKLKRAPQGSWRDSQQRCRRCAESATLDPEITSGPEGPLPSDSKTDVLLAIGRQAGREALSFWGHRLTEERLALMIADARWQAILSLIAKALHQSSHAHQRATGQDGPVLSLEGCQALVEALSQDELSIAERVAILTS